MLALLMSNASDCFDMRVIMMRQTRENSQNDNDLGIPLNPQNKFLSLIIRNTKLSQTYRSTIICLLIAFAIFISVSIAIFISMSSLNQITIQYNSQDSSCQQQGQACTINFQIPFLMASPVYLSYQLDDFYQNQRLFLQSMSNAQLAGQDISESQAQACHPFITNEQVGVTKSWAGVPLDPTGIANPCGSVARAFFNDSFALFQNNKGIAIDQSGISWPGDQGTMFQKAPNSRSTQWINPENQHFIVWMRTAGLPNFKKIWGSITQDLQPGSYQMVITNNYVPEGWSGDKFFSLSTVGRFGGKNYLLPIISLIISVGCLCSIAYIVYQVRVYRKLSED